MSLPLGGAADAAFVEAFLRANPTWLANRPDLYSVLEPPVRLHGDGVADHMAAMLRMQRERADGLLAAGRATAGLAGRVQDAVLALFRSSDPADCVSGEMPGISPLTQSAGSAERNSASTASCTLPASPAVARPAASRPSARSRCIRSIAAI